MKRKFCLILVAVMTLVMLLTACGNGKSEIESVTADFEKACNDVDLNAMLDCIDPTIASGLKFATGLAGMFSDKDTDELLDELSKLIFDNIPDKTEEFFSSIDISVDNISVDGETATADAVIKYEMSGEKYSNNAVFTYTMTDNAWYILSLNLK